MVEIVLGAFLIGSILVSQSSWETYVGPQLGSVVSVSGAPVYMTVYAYLAGLLLAVTLGLALRGLLSVPARRLARLRTSQLAVAISALVLAGGYTLTTQIAGWTANCSGQCSSPSPSLNTVVSSIAIDAGAGLIAALLPTILWLWCRGRTEAPFASPPPPTWPQ